MNYPRQIKATKPIIRKPLESPSTPPLHAPPTPPTQGFYIEAIQDKAYAALNHNLDAALRALERADHYYNRPRFDRFMELLGDCDKKETQM